MPVLSYDRPIRHVGLLAIQTLKTLEPPRHWFFWRSASKSELHDLVAAFVDAIVAINPSDLSEEQFAQLVKGLSRVIEALERYFASHGNANNPSECQFLGNSITTLKDSRKWLAQGLSPDASKRPAEAERAATATARAADVWSDLIA